MGVWLQCKHSAKFYVVFCKGFGGTKHICAAQEITRCDPRILSYLKYTTPSFWKITKKGCSVFDSIFSTS